MGEREGVMGEIATVTLVLAAHALNEACRAVESIVRMLRAVGRPQGRRTPIRRSFGG